MGTGLIFDVSREAIWVLLKCSMPILCITLLVSFIISLLQALTQVQEATLSFVPKILTVFITLMLFMPFIISNLELLTTHISEAIINSN